MIKKVIVIGLILILFVIYSQGSEVREEILWMGNGTGGGGIIDHGALEGLSDDDHIIYLLASGTRALTGNWLASFNVSLDVGNRFKGLIDCTNITGGSDGDFCADTAGAGGNTKSGAGYLFNDSDNIYLNDTLLNDSYDGTYLRLEHANASISNYGIDIGFNSTDNETYYSSIDNSSLNNRISVYGLLLGFNSTLNLTYDQWSYNQTSALALNDGLYVNYTNTTTTGDIDSGGLSGYRGANDLCSKEVVTGSHMCQMHEIINTINANEVANFTATMRVSEGAPGYLANADDCGGWTSNTGSYLGSIWIGDTTTGGSGSLVACNAARAIGCCA